VTYRGDKPIIKNNTAIVITDIALITASLIMFQKIANILSIASFLLITSTLGASYMGYKYVTSEQFKAKIMNQVLGEVKGLLPNVMNKALPKTTGESLPIPKKLGL
tara:strand:- start:562 stop:879 length:318 start_codon:yes stop_codon:yes gene_type:complete